MDKPVKLIKNNKEGTSKLTNEKGATGTEVVEIKKENSKRTLPATVGQ